MKAKSLVYYKDNIIEDEHEEHYGILIEDEEGDETVLCLCCGGILEEGDYILLENYGGFPNLENILEEHYRGLFEKYEEDIFVLLNCCNEIPTDAEAYVLEKIIETQLEKSKDPDELQSAIEKSSLECISYGVLVISLHEKSDIKKIEQ